MHFLGNQEMWLQVSVFVAVIGAEQGVPKASDKEDRIRRIAESDAK